MSAVQWLIGHWSIIIGESATAVLFGALGYIRGMKIKRAEMGLEIARSHREVWTYFDEHKELWPLHDKVRDLTRSPLTPAELRFAGRLFLHMHTAYIAERAGTYKRPMHLREDIRETFAYPALFEAWKKSKHLHDRDFVAHVEGFLV